MGQLDRLQSIQKSASPTFNSPPTFEQPENMPIPQPVVGIVDGTQTTNLQESSYQKAGFIVRWAASVLDGLLISIPLLAISIPFYKSDSEVIDKLSGLVVVIYSVIAIANYQTTLGKNFFNLKVISKDGVKIGYGKAIVREFLGKILSSIVLSLGYLWVIWDKEKQGWHDKIAGTYVVQTQELGKGKKMLSYILTFIFPLIAIVGILAAIILIGINPMKRVDDAREANERFEQQRLEREIQFRELDELQRN